MPDPANPSDTDTPTLAPLGGASPAPAPIPPPMPAPGGPVRLMEQPAEQPWAIARSTFPIVVSAGRVTNKNQVSEYRTGSVTIDATGITLAGKAVLSSTIRGIALLIGVFARLGWLLIYLIFEYAIRVNRSDVLLWDCIEGIQCEPEKQRVCIAYHLPSKPKTSYALGLRLSGGHYQEFLNSVREYAPSKLSEGKILSPTPPAVWWFLGALVLVILVMIVWAATH